MEEICVDNISDCLGEAKPNSPGARNRKVSFFYAPNHKHALKKIWKRPELHRDTEFTTQEQQYPATIDIKNRESSHRPEIWYELFYDLVFVAACTQLSHLLEHDTSWRGVTEAGILFVVLRSTWEQLIFYQNRFDTKDLLHYLFYLFEAICAYVIAEHFTIDEETGHWDVHHNMRVIALAAAAGRIGQSIMYMQIMYLTTRYRKHIIAITVSLWLASGIYLLSAVLPYGIEYYYIFWVVAEVVERSAVMLYIWMFVDAASAEAVHIPWHFEHLIHREGIFVLLILGEAIILLVQRDSDNDSLLDILFGIFSFASVFNIGDLYYQQQVVGYRHFKAAKTSSPTYLWIELHELLALSMLFFGVGVNLVYSRDRDMNGIHALSEELMMCCGASVSLVVIYVLRISYRLTDGLPDTDDRTFSTCFRFIVSIAIAFIPIVAPTARWTIGILFSLTLLLILQDVAVHLTSHRHHDNGRESFGSSLAPSELSGATPLLFDEEEHYG